MSLRRWFYGRVDKPVSHTRISDEFIIAYSGKGSTLNFVAIVEGVKA